MSAHEPPDALFSAASANPGLLFETGSRSDVGKVRKENEDSLISLPAIGVWAVADGMGGYTAGKLASSTVTDEIATIGQPVSPNDLLARLEDRIIRANARLREIGEAEGFGTFGTTVVSLLVSGGYYACVWCGDSRAYLMRNGTLLQVSRDHTEVQDLVDEGRITPEEARFWPGRNVINRAIGVSDAVELDLQQGVVEPEDVFLLCSDGLTGHVSDGEIRDLLAAHAPQPAADALVALTLQRGASDNVSVIVVRCATRVPDEPAETPADVSMTAS